MSDPGLDVSEVAIGESGPPGGVTFAGVEDEARRRQPLDRRLASELGRDPSAVVRERVTGGLLRDLEQRAHLSVTQEGNLVMADKAEGSGVSARERGGRSSATGHADGAMSSGG